MFMRSEKTALVNFRISRHYFWTMDGQGPVWRPAINAPVIDVCRSERYCRLQKKFSKKYSGKGAREKVLKIRVSSESCILAAWGHYKTPEEKSEICLIICVRWVRFDRFLKKPFCVIGIASTILLPVAHTLVTNAWKQNRKAKPHINMSLYQWGSSKWVLLRENGTGARWNFNFFSPQGISTESYRVFRL